MRFKALKISAAIAVIGIGLWVGTQLPSLADGEDPQAAPGSVDDPVVTKSYVDQKLASLTNTNPDDNNAADNNSIQIVNVPVGQMLIAKDGAEAVVRAGNAAAYSPDSNGIADVTEGTDIKSGSPVPNNHLILFPRGGRGIMPQEGQRNGLIVMVRGGYDLVQQDSSK